MAPPLQNWPEEVNLLGTQNNASRRPSHALLDWIAATGGFVTLLYTSFREALQRLLKPKQYLQLIVEQFYLLGIQSLPLVIVAGIATGAVMALQFGYGLKRYGGLSTVPMLVGLSVFRELGPVFTSLLLAGRVGSGITAELASMSVTQQLDAVRALGTSPNSTLVLPRIIACFFAFPVLGLCSDYFSVITAMFVSLEEFGLDPSFYISKTFLRVHMPDLITGISKLFIFGFIVALVACWKGITTRGGTRNVGMATTWVVVTSSILILLGDVVLNKVFILMGLFQ